MATALYFTQFLDDKKPKERNLGIRAGHDLLAICKEVHVFSMNDISIGMKKDITTAKKLGKIIRYYDKYPWQKTAK